MMMVRHVALWLLVVLGTRSFAQETVKPNRQDVELIIDEQKECVQTPEEFVTAFEAREARCVSDNLIGRIFSGSSVDGVYLQVDSKPATFYSGNDALEAYLRVGYPETFGYTFPSARVNFSAPDFPGTETTSSGFSLLQKIGYSPEYIDINRVYALTVFDTQAIDRLVMGQNASQYPFEADIGPLEPTWRAIKEFYEWVYNDLNLTISDESIDVLENIEFNTLTGCPSACAYAQSDFPSENATAPVVVKSRVEYESCPSAGPNAIEIYPSAANPDSELCEGYQGRDWKSKVEAMAAPFTAQYCDPAETVPAARILADKLANTTDVIDQAQWFRAFLVQSCVGGMNPLFSGNGFTYSGLGGLLTPTATEYIASPFNVSSLGKNESSTIYFCINGLNGGRPDKNGECPIPEVDIASQNLVTAATSSAPSVNGWGTRYMFWCTGASFVLMLLKVW